MTLTATAAASVPTCAGAEHRQVDRQRSAGGETLARVARVDDARRVDGLVLVARRAAVGKPETSGPTCRDDAHAAP